MEGRALHENPYMSQQLLLSFQSTDPVLMSSFQVVATHFLLAILWVATCEDGYNSASTIIGVAKQ